MFTEIEQIENEISELRLSRIQILTSGLSGKITQAMWAERCRRLESLQERKNALLREIGVNV